MLESVAVIAGLDDMAMMSESVEHNQNSMRLAHQLELH